MSKYKVVINPAAGGGAGRKSGSRVEALLGGYGLECEFLLTDFPGHAVEVARQAVLNEGFDVVVAIGGDGTSNEVINGLIDR